MKKENNLLVIKSLKDLEKWGYEPQYESDKENIEYLTHFNIQMVITLNDLQVYAESGYWIATLKLKFNGRTK